MIFLKFNPKFYVFSFLFLIYGQISSTFSDTTFFEETEGLIELSSVPDSTKYHRHPNPYSPTLISFAVFLNIYDSCFVKIAVNNSKNIPVSTFVWKRLRPGAYRFDWWKYVNDLLSGVYLNECNLNNNTQIHKALIVN